MNSVHLSLNEFEINKEILYILLKDNTTNNNIIWASDEYAKFGILYKKSSELDLNLILSNKKLNLKCRVNKEIDLQSARTRNNAEVFTPSWICNKQLNLFDNDWFGSIDVFNSETNIGWNTNYEKIRFKNNNTWIDYVKLKRLEMACGEGPYITSRYDMLTGNYVEVKDRIGILDRKIRVVYENTTCIEEWFKWTIEAYKSTYGFELQGDNLFIARQNLILTFIENYEYKFFDIPSLEMQQEIANIIAWNIFQMDGLKFVVPNSCVEVEDHQQLLDLFGDEQLDKKACPGCKKNSIKEHTGIYSKIMNWETNKIEKLIDSVREKI